MKKTNIKDAVLAITYRCNSRCRMCSIWQIKEHENEFSIADLSNLPAGLSSLNISGGEPFLRQDLDKIVEKITKDFPNINLTISTNGFATPSIIKKTKELLEINPNIGIAVSLDGTGEAHDEIRGIPGGFERVLKTVKELKQLGIKSLRLAFTIGDYNFDELKKVYNLSKELGVEMTLAAVHSSENFFNKENKIETKEEIIKQLEWLINKELDSFNIKRWLRAYFTYGLKKFLKTGKRILPDYSGKLNIFIDPKGNVYPCDISSQKIGNIKKGREISETDKSECEKSWMICTAREAIKKHWFRAIFWIVKNKFFNFK